MITSKDHDKIKTKLLKRHENGGRPIILLENMKYKGGNEILLRHQFDELPLDSTYVKHTLKMLHKIVQRPVNIKTIDVEVSRITSYDHTGGNPFSPTNGWTFRQKNRDEITRTPVIYKFDGARFTRVKDERSAREAKHAGENI